MTFVELLPPEQAVHGSDRWYELRRAGVTASEIAVVLGISPYGSPFSLYWQKVNDWRDDGNAYTSVGRHLEDAIAEWWIAEHDPLQNLALGPAGLFAHPERRWQLATPDRLIQRPCDWCERGNRTDPATGDPADCQGCGGTGAAGAPLALLECKWVAHSWDGWGEPGTDDIPVYYRAQVLWQLDVLGLNEAHVAALGPGGFRAYTLHLDERAEDDLRVMRGHGVEFMGQLTASIAPDLDGHHATIAALRKFHPGVGEGDVEVPVELAEEYRHARAQKKAYEETIARCEAQIRAALGSEFNRAVCNGKLVASRSVYDQSGDSAELTALEDDWPVVDRLNPGRSTSYA